MGGDLRAALSAASVQRVLYPLARAVGVRNYAALSKDALVDAILATGAEHSIREALAGKAPAEHPSYPAHPEHNGRAVAVTDDTEDEAAALLAAVKRVAALAAPPVSAGQSVDPETVRAIVREEIAGMARRVEYVPAPGAPPVDCGIQHAAFPRLLRMVNARQADGARLVPLLVGPPGTGKSTAAKAVAKALGLERYAYTGALDSPYGLLGYQDAHGRYVRTAFRECWEHGGVFLFDELFASHPSVLVVFNGSIANGLCAFPDGMVHRHPDCVIIGADNTTGHGGSTEYAGRVRQDGAFLDRFAMLTWPIDPALETALSRSRAWHAAVLAARKVASERKLSGACISPRAVLKGDALLQAGDTFAEVAEACMRNGLADAAWSDVLSAARAAWEAAGGKP